MALIYCSACGKQISSEAAACPNCGHPRAEAKPSATSSKGMWASILLGVVMGVIILVFLIGKPSEERLRKAVAENARKTAEDYVRQRGKIPADRVAVLGLLAGADSDRRNSFTYHDRIFWSELTLYEKGPPIVAFGICGFVKVPDEPSQR